MGGIQALLRRDLAADGVLLTVQLLLLGLRDVAAILTGHVAFFLPYLVVLVMQVRGLRFAQGSGLDVLMNPLVLIAKTMIHLGAPRMILLPRGFRGCGAGESGERYHHGGEAKMFAC